MPAVALADRISSSVTTETLRDIYAFWFGEHQSRDDIDPERIRFWMHRNDDTDRIIRQSFLSVLRQAAREAWTLDRLSREEAMALVVLFDQFPRNIFRDDQEAFAYDHLARDLARPIVANDWDRCTASEQFMLTLPFVHHEDIADQDLGVMLSARLVLSAPEAKQAQHRGSLDQAIRHRDVIQRFGRFPHRNAMLGRPSTAEEVAFLATAMRGRGF